MTERPLIGSLTPGGSPVAFLMTALIASGFAVAIYYASKVTLSFLGVLVLVGVLLFTMRTFVLWQRLAFVALAGFVILNYGFTNWTPIPGKPLPAGHLLLVAAVVLAVQQRPREAAGFLDEPAVLWWLLLVGLSVSHLVFDVPRYGTYAVRDASFVFEGLFMFLGFILARRRLVTPSFLKALAVMFLLNTAYGLTFPIADTLAAFSPVSGIFQQVPLLGSYAHTPLFLVAGGLYYLLVMRHVRTWPPGFILLLAALQVSWSFVFQERSVYIGTAIAIVLLLLLGGARRGVGLVALLTASVVAFFAVIAMTGSGIQGRVGEVEPGFLVQHVQSLFGDPDTPAASTVQWRLDLWSQLRERWSADSMVMAIGEGFGQPLIEFENSSNVAVRQPHNTHITVLIRLGALGFLMWLMMHFRIFTALLRSLWNSERETLNRDLALWLFLLFVLGMVFTTFQPWLEFSYGAIPFFFFAGIALAMARPRQDDSMAREAQRLRTINSDSPSYGSILG